MTIKQKRSNALTCFVNALQKQTVLKTRQLWHLREQQGKELQQYQVGCQQTLATVWQVHCV